MDSTLARAVSRAIPDAGSNNWPFFALLLALVLVVAAPRIAEVYRQKRSERGEPVAESNCAVHAEKIKQLESDLEELRMTVLHGLSELRTEIVTSGAATRDFIDEKLTASRMEERTERQRLEDRLSSRLTEMIDLLSSTFPERR